MFIFVIAFMLDKSQPLKLSPTLLHHPLFQLSARLKTDQITILLPFLGTFYKYNPVSWFTKPIMVQLCLILWI